MKFSRFLTSLLVASLFALGAQAQVPSLPNSPFNVPAVTTVITAPLSNKVITNTAAGAGTVLVGPLQNIAYNGIVCTFNQASHTGTPSTTIEIDAFDAASGLFVPYVTSGAITADATPTQIAVYPGIQTATLPAGMVAINLKLPRYFRVKQVIGGTTPGVTGTVGCDLLK